MMRETDQKLLGRAIAVARRAIPSCDWSTIGDMIVADRLAWEKHLHKPARDINYDLAPGLERLQTDGFVVHPLRLEPEKVAAIRKHLEGLPVHAGYHVYQAEQRLWSLPEVQSVSPLAGYTSDQLLRTPYLVDFLNHPAIIDFLQMALGCVPTLYSINAWWSFPGTSPVGDGAQHFHRDNDDWKFITLFLYLTDVDEDSGPHQLIVGSHTLQGMKTLLQRAESNGMQDDSIDAILSFTNDNYFGAQFSASCERLFKGSIVNIGGPAGTMFMANTIAIHRGLMPLRTPRLLIWARYGLGPNTNSADLEQGPLARIQVKTNIPDTSRNRYINRLLFEFDRRPGLFPDFPDQTDVSAPEDIPVQSPLRGRFSRALRVAAQFLHRDG